MENMGGPIASFIVNVAIAAAIFIVGRWIAKKIVGAARKIMEKREVDPILINFGASAIHIGLVVFIVVAALGQLGIQTTSFVAIIGAAGLAIALAFQGSLSNLASGVLLVTFRPFKIGDFVEAAGTAGVVEKIEIFTTQI
ncbi:MAG: mechanosensitive ion channel domain-containing protein, partial [Gammaproteobacteria bacterium]